MKDRISLLLASAFYLGMSPVAPGTVASLATTSAYYLVYRISFRILPELHLSVICLIVVAGVYVSDRAGRALGENDPSQVVIDEVAGQLLAFLLLPVSFLNLIAGTVLFRLFDIWKPFPIRRLETLGNGVGVMADDLLAGAYANLVLQVLHRILNP
jgi:phosphatidylglycerophosphatase A